MSGVDSAAADLGSSGLAQLRGLPGGARHFSRSAARARARRVADEFRRRTAVGVDAATILAGRAALLGVRRRGRISAGGGPRLLAGWDGWVAITLSRPDGVDAV